VATTGASIVPRAVVRTTSGATRDRDRRQARSRITPRRYASCARRIAERRKPCYFVSIWAATLLPCSIARFAPTSTDLCNELQRGGGHTNYRESMRRVAGLVAAALLLAACTSDPESEPKPDPRPVPTSPPPWVTETPPAEPTTRPLVFAVNARRPPMSVPKAVAGWIRQGIVDNWDQLGQPSAPLRTTDRTDHLDHLPMDTIAIVVADAVGPAVRVLEVDGVDPLRDPDDYAIQVAGPPHAPVTTMTVVGDVMLGRSVTGHPALDPMAARLASADMTVGNLESTLSQLGPPMQDPAGDSFYAQPRVRADLRDAGFDVLGLANNHLGDFGDESLVRTVELLRGGGFATFGAGRDLARASEPVVVERHGTRFGFLGFNAIGETTEAAPGQPGALSVSMPPRTGPLDRAELARVVSDVRRLARRVDVVTVMPHWGTQYTNRPEPIQGVVARALVKAGADLVVGGHPHWVQGASMVGDALLVNSLGNFVFDMDTEQTQEGLVLEATFWGDRLMAADFVPYRIGSDFAPRVVSRASAGATFDRFWEFSDLAATR
jgi:poly-gamma-glutamate capsule biosynthesis protein CapA/YwtB (metallophosphatase superfamily)